MRTRSIFVALLARRRCRSVSVSIARLAVLREYVQTELHPATRRALLRYMYQMLVVHLARELSRSSAASARQKSVFESVVKALESLAHN